MNWTRRDLFRAGAAVALGAPAVLASCSKVPQAGEGGTLQRIKDAGAIKIGIAGEVPYGYTQNGTVTGEAPEVAKAVFKAMGIDRVEATQVEFGQLIPALNANQYDMVAAGMAILPDRCRNAQFSAVDYVTPTALLVPTGNPQRVNNFGDVKARGVTLAVLSGTVEEAVARDLGIPAGNIQPYRGQPEMFQALRDQRAYCGALTDISLRRMLADNPGAPMEVTKGFVPVVDGKEQIQAGGFVFRKGDDELVEKFNTELKRLQDNGSWLEIVTPFGFTADNQVPDDVTTDKLCEAV
ncbi:ectoine/hydroxyectoine ABC transporter substrate-binding protein EhuB [Mycolicibacterium sp. (ex Dasyatis americana)]|uniref:Ectoine/hydroxyectoine ABC transporter substrate-binding protein EhuB n=2 Tax=Mycobacteriaceae TaxID=1762 RepID=A0A1S1KKZ6_9MYCO|nr:ectoine/hydroxyectoine ABC transporter substrate-binding protein EhuB [Mycolicibacterium sp. (ex Dasyatis americana)]OHU07453.1 ectoine/hydroxyectoine ABC transporter substrate-binding protein EhuB [Mycobacterium syngnathidarum]OLT96386.1 ectoine/hydroxyectoine ABC transporter substrate-binding protein EhuB [Mycobacterium syngnathidarum]TMS50561.1 ectoine/hydroxyectoine ABC transporter substrate-binding protein EhuB [Mycobacterium sp. DBP42]